MSSLGSYSSTTHTVNIREKSHVTLWIIPFSYSSYTFWLYLLIVHSPHFPIQVDLHPRAGVSFLTGCVPLLLNPSIAPLILMTEPMCIIVKACHGLVFASAPGPRLSTYSAYLAAGHCHTTWSTPDLDLHAVQTLGTGTVLSFIKYFIPSSIHWKTS